METIKHAAVKSVDGWVFIGKCHADCFHKAHHIQVPMSQKADDQGFVTSTGRYVKRHEAWGIAFNANQIEIKKGQGTGEVRSQILFSEDLWCDRYEGKFNYDEVMGYIPKAVTHGS